MKGKRNGKYHFNLTAKVPEQMFLWRLKRVLLLHFLSCVLKGFLRLINSL